MPLRVSNVGCDYGMELGCDGVMGVTEPREVEHAATESQSECNLLKKSKLPWFCGAMGSGACPPAESPFVIPVTSARAIKHTLRNLHPRVLCPYVRPVCLCLSNPLHSDSCPFPAARRPRQEPFLEIVFGDS